MDWPQPTSDPIPGGSFLAFMNLEFTPNLIGATDGLVDQLSIGGSSTHTPIDEAVYSRADYTNWAHADSFCSSVPPPTPLHALNNSTKRQRPSHEEEKEIVEEGGSQGEALSSKKPCIDGAGKSRRSQRACTECRKNKIRCTFDSNPKACDRCDQSGMTCRMGISTRGRISRPLHKLPHFDQDSRSTSLPPVIPQDMVESAVSSNLLPSPSVPNAREDLVPLAIPFAIPLGFQAQPPAIENLDSDSKDSALENEPRQKMSLASRRDSETNMSNAAVSQNETQAGFMLPYVADILSRIWTRPGKPMDHCSTSLADADDIEYNTPRTESPQSTPASDKPDCARVEGTDSDALLPRQLGLTSDSSIQRKDKEHCQPVADGSLAVLEITSTTSPEVVVNYFRYNSGLSDYTADLEDAECSRYPIATGGLADVYRATLKDGTVVAIKRMRSNFVSEGKAVKRTARELYTWSKLKHHNILDILGLAMFGGKLAMISPWMNEGSIMQYVERNPDLDRYLMIAQVVEAVVYLHDNNVVHGDLKGDNILVSNDGTLKITDFGLTLMHQQAVQFSTTDNSGGTYRWMAPELINGEGVRSKETDVYALGMTMLQIVTGKLPFCEISSDISIINKVVLHDQRPARPDTSSQNLRSSLFWDLLERCWVREPDSRAQAEAIKVLVSALQPHKN